MHVDAKNLVDNSEIRGDICIIGAGAAGISMALDLNDTSQKVILLEGGGFEYDEQVQKLYEGKTTGQKYYPLSSTRLHYFGGTTGTWGGYCSPLDEMDFEERSWVPNSGWPISLKDLEPFYKKATDLFELQSENFNSDYWMKKTSTEDHLKMNKNVVYNKMWQFSPPTRFGEKYKESIVNSKNIHLYTYANVTNIKTDENLKNVEEVIIKNHNGKKHKVKAKKIILAAGAIQNARLLLASNTQCAKGLGNEYDLVGRYFMEHIELNSAELWLKHKIPMAFYSFHGAEKTKARAELAISSASQKKFKILNGTASLKLLAKARHIKPFIDVYGLPGKWHREEKTFFERISNKIEKINESNIDNIEKAYMLYSRIEQAPNPNSRVFIAGDKDALGVARANLHWEITDFEKRSIRKIYEIIGHQIGLSDLGRIRLLESLRDVNDKSWPEFTTPGLHHMGTTRMSNDPKKGVVDSNCKVHGISNLYVASSSCFPTSGAANPTYTIVALSLRLSDYLNKINKS